MEILFVGEAWAGSSARSMREALAALSGVSIIGVDEDDYFPRHRRPLMRAVQRVTTPLNRYRLRGDLVAVISQCKPDAMVVYKGTNVPAQLVRWAKSVGTFTANIFPDASPHAHGGTLKEAMGEYDLVVSTKVFHPRCWQSLYGYKNTCVFVPHGYDPSIHLWPSPPAGQDIDVMLVATWRNEYHQLMLALAGELGKVSLKVLVAGAGWPERASQFPSSWAISGAVCGRDYGLLLRRAKIAIAPVDSGALVHGVRQPSDEDTTRTYELAAAHCFFLHRRTGFVETIYNEFTEVPMWDSAEELAKKVIYFLPRESERMAMAARAHFRAVPNYSIPARATQVYDHIIEGRKAWSRS